MTPVLGRRERRKLQTRQALADAAFKLFEVRGYDGVTVAQIADEADVSIATMFKHVPDGKPALMFDDGTERQERLLASVRDRAPGTSVLTALRAFLATRGVFTTNLPPELRRKRELIMNTPALAEYQRKLWLASEDALADVLAAASSPDTPHATIRALARYVLEVPELAGKEPNPRAALDAIFERLHKGWCDT